MNEIYDKIVNEAEDRDILNDIETPENKLLSEIFRTFYGRNRL